MANTVNMSHSTWIKRWVWPLLAITALVVVVITSSLVEQRNRDSLASQEIEIAHLDEQLTAQLTKTDEAASIAQARDVGAPDEDGDGVIARIKADEKVIRDLVTAMFTWDSHETYEAARTALVEDYGIPSDSQILTTLMPPGPVNIDGEGVEYPYIDAAGLDSAMADFTATPAFITRDEYSYVVLVTVVGSSTDGTTSASVTNLVDVTVDGSGDLTRIEAYATQMPIKSAQ